MKLGLRTGRALGAILAVVAIGGTVPAAPALADVTDIHPSRWSSIATLEKLGVPSGLIEVLAADQTTTFSGSYVDVMTVGDLDRDGRSDLLAGLYRYEVTFNDSNDPLAPPLQEKVHSRLRVISGRDGRPIWHKNYKSFIWPVRARVGQDARRGLFMIHGLGTWTGPIEDRELRIDALEGASGKRIWRRTYRSVVSESTDVSAYVGVPSGLDVFDGLPGKQTDLLVSVSDVAGDYSTFVSRTTTNVIHGADGAQTQHPAQDVSVNWITGAWAVGDVGGTRFDDYVVPAERGVALPSDQEPPEVGGIVTARTGATGADIWVEGGYEFVELAWVYQLGDAIGDAHRDIGIVTLEQSDPSTLFGFNGLEFLTYLTDAGAGNRIWRKPDGWPNSPGDIDGDGKAEVITRDAVWRQRRGELVFQQHAFEGSGRKLWKRDVVRSYEVGPCPGSCGAGYGSGWMNVGDLHGDGLQDTFVMNSIQQDPGEDSTFNYTVSGGTGRVVDSGGQELQAFGAAIDGRGTDVVDVDASGTDLSLTARSGDKDRLLWRTQLTFDTLFDRRASRSLTGLDLGRDGCDDVVAVVDSPKATIVVAIDGASGRIKWQRTVDGDARILDSTVTDRLHRC
jgi:hypothetical protein